MTARRLLITGATGNVGRAVIAALEGSGHHVVAGLRDPADAADLGVAGVLVDLAHGTGPDERFDAIFLMRPPQIANPAPFRAFLDRHDRATRIVFLSVVGADTKSYLPHAKIEALVREMGFAHVFVRPGYFMENLTTTLAAELARTGRIVLPAGRLGFDWVSARDVGAVVARTLVLPAPPETVTVATGHPLGFEQALAQVNAAARTSFRYAPLSVIGYLRHARRQNADWAFVAVMLLLHSLPRILREQPKPGDAETVLCRPLETLADWASRNQTALQSLHN